MSSAVPIVPLDLTKRCRSTGARHDSDFRRIAPYRLRVASFSSTMNASRTGGREHADARWWRDHLLDDWAGVRLARIWSIEASRSRRCWKRSPDVCDA